MGGCSLQTKLMLLFKIQWFNSGLPQNCLWRFRAPVPQAHQDGFSMQDIEGYSDVKTVRLQFLGVTPRPSVMIPI